MKFLLFSLLVGCSQFSSTSKREIASVDKHGKALALEVVPASEPEATKEVLELLKTGYSNYKQKDLKPQAHRIIHGKHHGCVTAEFIVRKDLPKNLQHGVFAEPGATYPAWVRLSNGSGRPKHDKMPDGRGLAIKLMKVEGKKLSDEVNTQDFLLQSAPNFFAKDVQAYVKFMKQAAHPGAKGVGKLVTSINPMKKEDRQSVGILAKSAGFIRNPLTATYFSALPQLLGPHAMKLKAAPCAGVDPRGATFSQSLGKNFLKESMEKHLTESDACIEVFAQLQTDATKMPIENATVVWDPKSSPFVSVGKLIIPKQTFTSEKRQNFCEHISFTPWHALPEHRPLGGLNRVRKLVYEGSHHYRHELNQQAPSEPNPDDKME